MTTATISALEAQALAIDSILTLARVEMERKAASVTAAVHLCRATYHFRRLDKALTAHWTTLRVNQMKDIADHLHAGAMRVSAQLHPEIPASFDLVERWNHRCATNVVTDVERMVDSLRAEIAQRCANIPTLNPSVYRDAVMASAFMRPVTPDSAEGEPDPLYEF